MLLYNETQLRGLAEEYYSLFYQYITRNINTNFNFCYNNFGKSFQFNLEITDKIECGKTFHIQDKENNDIFWSYSFINSKLSKSEIYYISAHEFAHWIFFINSIKNNELNYYNRERVRSYINSIKNRVVAMKLLNITKDSYSIKNVIPTSIEEVKSRFRIEEYPVCSIARFLILPTTTLYQEYYDFIDNKNTDISILFKNIQDKYSIPPHVIMLRLFDENLGVEIFNSL